MELQQTIQATCRVAVTLQDSGALSAKVLASAPYNAEGCTATAELPVSEQHAAELQRTLRQVLEDATPRLGEALGAAIHTAREAAKRLGE